MGVDGPRQGVLPGVLQIEGALAHDPEAMAAHAELLDIRARQADAQQRARDVLGEQHELTQHAVELRSVLGGLGLSSL